MPYPYDPYNLREHDHLKIIIVGTWEWIANGKVDL